MKLTIDQQLQLAVLLRGLSDHDFGDLPEFRAGEWSRDALEAITRDVERGPLPDLRRS